MLLKRSTLKGVAEGHITLAFRRWRRPAVKAGGTLLTSVGQLAIDSVEEVAREELSDTDAVAAGFADRDELLAVLDRKETGDIYRVALRLVGPDPRIVLREQLPDQDEMEEIAARLERWDRASPVGAWTVQALSIIEELPGVRAGDLATELDMEVPRFKTNVRKLKGLGLTESLEIGYRLSPRGHAVLESIETND